MLTFTTEKIVTSIKRATYSGTPPKSTYADIGSATCYLRPLAEEAATMNGGQFGYAFNAIFEVSVDIREGDKIVISGVEYTVRGVVNHDRGFNTPYKRCLLTKPENA